MRAKLKMGNNSRNTKRSVMGFQLCTMFHCKKHAQKLCPWQEIR